jgi:hypothetical protein
MYRRVESGSNGSHHHTINCLTDLVLPSEHVEALLPALAIACLRLNSSSGKVDKHILQSVFACALFFNRAKLVPFAIHSRVAKRTLLPKQGPSFMGNVLWMCSLHLRRHLLGLSSWWT